MEIVTPSAEICFIFLMKFCFQFLLKLEVGIFMGFNSELTGLQDLYIYSSALFRTFSYPPSFSFFRSLQYHVQTKIPLDFLFCFVFSVLTRQFLSSISLVSRIQILIVEKVGRLKAFCRTILTTVEYIRMSYLYIRVCTVDKAVLI